MNLDSGNRATHTWFGLVLLAVLIFNALVLAHFHDRFWWPPDDGQYAHTAERMLQGDVIHRDIHEVHPAIHFVHVAAFRLFGDRMVSLRYPLIAASLLQSLLVLLLLRGMGHLAAAAGSVATVAFGTIQFLNPTPNWYCVLFAVIAAFLLVDPQIVRPGRFELVGLVIGASFLFRQLSGAILGVAVLAWLLARERATDARADSPSGRWASRAFLILLLLLLSAWLYTTTDLLGFVLIGIWPLLLLIRSIAVARTFSRTLFVEILRLKIGFLGAFIPLLVYHAAHHSLRAFGEDVFVRAFSVARFPYLSLASFGDGLAAGALAVAQHRNPAVMLNGIYWIALPLLPAAVGVLALRQFWTDRSLHPFVWLAAFAATGALFNQIPIYLYYAVTLSAPALLFLVRSRRARVGLSLALLAMAAIAIRDHAAQSLARGLSGTFAGKRMSVEPIGIPKLSISTDHVDAEVYRRLLGIIQKETKDGDPIFVFPNDAEIYYFSGRRNPFSFFNTAVDIQSPADAFSVIAGLQRIRPRLVIFVPGDKYRMPAIEPIVEFVRRHYRQIALIGRFEVDLLTD